MRKYKLVFGILALCVFVCGCTEDKYKTLVSAHTTIGELLIATKDQAILLHNQKTISDNTYESIRINWLRAQKTYISASELLDKVISSESSDVSNYLEMLSQTNLILMDITRWLSESLDKAISQEKDGGIK